MAIECVTLATNHLFPGNPVCEQHRLRHRTIIRRQGWDVPQIGDMEYDEYDNPAAVYLVWRDPGGKARGVSRLYPTDRPFMLQEKFSAFVTYRDMPCGSGTLEGSRFCVDNSLPPDLRTRIASEIVAAYLEYGLARGAARIVGIMYPAYWRNLFARCGWNPVWLGDVVVTPDGKKSRAASLEISEATSESVRRHAGIDGPVLVYGAARAQAA
jgi:N-acyl-L-homoserine lactone synthetase